MFLGDTRLYLIDSPYAKYYNGPYAQQKEYPTKFNRTSSGYLIKSEWKQKSKITEKQFIAGSATNVITTVTDLAYANKNISQPTQTLTTNSNNSIYKVQNYFSHDLQSNTAHPSVPAMIGKNMIGIPLKTEVYVNNAIINAQEMAYDVFATNQLLPKFIRNRLKNGTWETLFTVNNYNAVGLPIQTTAKGFNVSTSYSWSRDLIVSKSFGSVYPNLLTWTYGYGYANMVASATDENGLIKKFEYDGLMRLKKVHDRMKPDGTDIQATTVYEYQYKNATNPYSFVGTSTTFKGVTTPLSTKQYMDGLGRPIEVVKEYYTPKVDSHPNDAWHQKSYVSYDSLGRQNKTYLPFESSTLGVQLPPAYTSSFVLTEFEASPLSRPVKQTHVDNTIVLTSYAINTALDSVRIMVAASGNGASVSGASFYAANLLYKTTMTDENGKQTCIFKDKLGRVLLTRKFLGTQKVDTYNVYDDYGQLVAVLPPGSVGNTGVVTNSLTFQYKYDNQNRLSEKKVPGASLQKFYYDSRDLLVLTQDGNMAAENPTKHLATLYDDLGRVIKTGFAFVSPTQGQNFTLTDAQITDKLTETIYYPNKSWVKHQGAKVLKPAGVSTPTNFIWSYVERRAGYEYTGNPIWSGKQHLLDAAVPQRPIDDSDVYGVDWSVSWYNGMQQPDGTKRYLFVNGNTGQQVRTWTNFTYDHARRMTDMKYSYGIDGTDIYDPTFTLSNMVYNFKDQLTEKNIGYVSTTQALQSIDYAYNLRGWLTAINSVSVHPNLSPIYTPGSTGTGTIQNLAVTPFIQKAIGNVVKNQMLEDVAAPPVTDNNDLFSENIYYNGADSRFQATPQYNGNIQAVAWQVAGRAGQGQGFTYDDLDRLTNAKYFDLTNTSSQGTHTTTFSTDYKFNESQTYDLRGNITSLQRNGLNGGTWTTNGYTAATYGMIDNLTYTYNAQNQALIVKDASLLTKGFKSVNNPNATQYTYDVNGNLKSDLNKGITSIEYNYLNLPQVITFTGNRTIQFVYDASGVKLRKITNNNGVIETTDYINGVEYKNNVLERIAHTEGGVTRQVYGATGAVSYNHEYVLRDHLGNTRVTFTDGVSKGDPYWDWYSWSYIDPNADNLGYNDGIITSADIKQINNYYPFGLNMEGNWNGAAGSNKYQYNGKEWNDDFGLGWNDYGARWYDPAIGRWGVIDPLNEKFYQWSPYHYTNGNPIKYIDLFGMESSDPNEVRKQRAAKSEERREATNAESESRENPDDWVKKGNKIYNDHSVSDEIDAVAKGLEYLGNNVLLKDTKTGTGYFLPICSEVAECWGVIGPKATITNSRNPDHLKEDDPNYLPPNSVAFGIQATVSFDGILSSASFSGGVAVGSGQIGVFVSSSGGGGLKAPGLGLGFSLFQASTSGTADLRNLEGPAMGGTGSFGVASFNYSRATYINSPTKIDPKGYKLYGFGIGTPSVGGKVEVSSTKVWATPR